MMHGQNNIKLAHLVFSSLCLFPFLVSNVRRIDVSYLLLFRIRSIVLRSFSMFQLNSLKECIIKHHIMTSCVLKSWRIMFTIYTLGHCNVRTFRPMEHTFIRAKDVHTIQRITIIHFPMFGDCWLFFGNFYLFYYAPCGTCFRKH